MSEVVTDPAVVARLPRATWQVEWQWRSWRITGGPIGTMRYANAKGYFLGPLFVCRPMPWLLGPARSLHPEVFEAALAEPVQEPQGCDHCNHPLYAATKCRVCGRVTEPPQRNPVGWDGRCMLGHCNSPAGCENSGECRAVERAHGIGGEG